ncbi:MAG: hypothetical protein NTV69_00575 [Caldilinea sp.]|jgi:hypothetical protein|nr:hypothetical protein [Chloroflexota bacterium]MCX6039623.1 hypothetical protein [Caldilinea sp.]
MIWTYRVVRDEIGRYSVREVYQERDGTLITYSKTPAAPIGSSAEDLLHQMQSFRDAFELPILSIAELEAVLSKQENKRTEKPGASISLQELKAELGLEPEFA